MPGIHRRRPGDGLFPARQVLDDVGELAIGRQGADIEFVDRISHAVAFVLRTMRVAGVGRFGHPDAQVSHRNIPIRELQRGRSALAVGNRAHGKGLPGALVDSRVERFQLASPELHVIARGVGIGPGDPDGIDIDLRAQVDHHPLRMQRVIFAREGFGQVWIALPVGIRVAVG